MAGLIASKFTLKTMTNRGNLLEALQLFAALVTIHSKGKKGIKLDEKNVYQNECIFQIREISELGPHLASFSIKKYYFL